MATASTAELRGRLSTPVNSTRWAQRAFYTTLPILMTTAVAIGFAPTYYLKTFYGTPALAPLYHVHGFLFSTWMVLLMVQPALVAAGRVDLHRRVGAIGGVLVAVMAVAAYFVSIDLGRRGAAPPGIPPLSFMLVPFSTVLVFPALIGSALYFKRQPEIHKRLMLIGTMELIPAGLGRWPALAPYGPLGFFGSADLFLVAMLAFDTVRRGRPHPATIYGGLFLVASQVARVLLSGTNAWISLAGWLIS